MSVEQASIEGSGPPIMWRRLAPQRPLEPGSEFYVLRPQLERIAQLVRRATTPIVVTGPVGCGKSTELSAACKDLQTDHVACLVPLDRLLNLTECTKQDIELVVAKRILELAVEKIGLPVSSQIQTAVGFHGLFPGEEKRSERDLMLAAVREVAAVSKQNRIALFLDGLEKAPKHVVAQALDVILDLQSEAQVVFVAGHGLTLGADADPRLAEARVVSLSPLWVEATGKDEELDKLYFESVTFFANIVKHRIGDVSEPGFEQVVTHAAQYSGGIPRTFLQLLQDAAGNAQLRGKPIPTLEDLESVAYELGDNLARLLQQGDVEELTGAWGKDGIEVPIDRRLRFLAQGLMLDYRIGRRRIVKPHPLLEIALPDRIRKTRLAHA